jgi:hypothetical protein
MQDYDRICPVTDLGRISAPVLLRVSGFTAPTVGREQMGCPRRKADIPQKQPRYNGGGVNAKRHSGAAKEGKMAHTHENHDHDSEVHAYAQHHHDCSNLFGCGNENGTGVIREDIKDDVLASAKPTASCTWTRSTRSGSTGFYVPAGASGGNCCARAASWARLRRSGRCSAKWHGLPIAGRQCRRVDPTAVASTLSNRQERRCSSGSSMRRCRRS